MPKAAHLFDSSEDEEEFNEQGVPGENISEEEDNIEICEEDEDQDDSDGDDSFVHPDAEQFVAKSGRKWYSSPPIKRRRISPTINSGPTELCDAASSVGEVFALFISDAIVEKICKHTNEEAMRTHVEKENSGWKKVDNIEMRSFIGILILGGALRCSKDDIDLLWSTNPMFSRPIFTASMSRDRFTDLLRYTRFDDKTTRTERRLYDKMAPIREIHNEFVSNCLKLYTPGTDVTIDEELVPFRGKCPFKQFIKSKPARYGIKVWALADVESTYLYNMQVYCGKVPGSKPEVGQGERVVCNLVEPLINTKRTIFADNFFTCPKTVDTLLTKGLYITGTVRKKRTDIPNILNVEKGREVPSSLFIFSSDGNSMAVSHVPKKRKVVRVISLRNLSTEVSPDPPHKPKVILEYNKGKGGVDNADRLLGEYTCARATGRWPLKLFFNLLDTAALNAFVIWIKKNPDWKTRKTNRRQLFLLELGEEMVKPNIQRRADNPIGFQNHIRHAIQTMGIRITPQIQQTTPEQTIDSLPTGNQKRGRCFYCKRNNDTKVQTTCMICKKFICANHRTITSTAKCLQNCKTDDL